MNSSWAEIFVFNGRYVLFKFVVEGVKTSRAGETGKDELFASSSPGFNLSVWSAKDQQEQVDEVQI